MLFPADADAQPKQGLPQSETPACSCAMADFSYRWRTAAAVFTGVIQKVEIVEAMKLSELDDPPVLVTIAVRHGFKSVKDDTSFEMHTSLNNATCSGYPFKEGEAYLFFAYQRDEGYEHWSLYNFPTGTYGEGGLCCGTQKLEDAQADMVEIRTLLKISDDQAAAYGAMSSREKLSYKTRKMLGLSTPAPASTPAP